MVNYEIAIDIVITLGKMTTLHLLLDSIKN